MVTVERLNTVTHASTMVMSKGIIEVIAWVSYTRERFKAPFTPQTMNFILNLLNGKGDLLYLSFF